MAQIGTVRLETQNSGVVDVPVFEPGDSASGIYEFVRVETASGPGFIPVTDPVDATYPYLRVQSQNNGIVAVTDTPGSDIPDAQHYHIGDEGSGTELADSIGGSPIRLNGPTWVIKQSFSGGVGIDFGAGDSATATLTQPNSFTWMIRVAAGNLNTGDSNAYRVVIDTTGNKSGNNLVYNVADEAWRWPSDVVNDMPDAQTAVESEDRILVVRYNDSTSTGQLDVFKNDLTLVGTVNYSGSISYGSQTTTLGIREDGTRQFDGLMDPNAIWAASSISDDKRDQWLADYF